jgi:GNAT superfamily N-acetyltransferase
VVDLVPGCVDTLHAYFELGNSTTPAGRASLVSAPACPRVYDANCATRIRAATTAEIDEVLAEVDRQQGDLDHRCFKVDPLTPSAFEARLVLDGYGAEVELQSVLEGPLRDAAPPRHPAPPIDIRAVVSGADWASLAALMRSDHEETAAKADRACWAAEVTDQMVEQKRRKAPDVQFFLARAGDRDCAFFSSWPGVGGIGKVEDLFTAVPWRHRGIATALIGHAVDDARRRGAGPVLIGAVDDDTPKSMYAALGFQPVLLYRSYVKS